MVNFSSSTFVDVPLLTDTSAYAPADVLVATAAVPGVAWQADFPVVLNSMVVINTLPAQTFAADFYFLDANVSFGPFNAAVALTAANALNILGFKSVVDADFKSLVLSKVAYYSNMGIIVKPAAGSSDIYIAAVLITGTPTFGAASLKLRLGFVKS